MVPIRPWCAGSAARLPHRRVPAEPTGHCRTVACLPVAGLRPAGPQSDDLSAPVNAANAVPDINRFEHRQPAPQGAIGGSWLLRGSSHDEAGVTSARHGTRYLAPPSRDTAVGRAQPTPATAGRRSRLGEDSVAKTNPFRAVEAGGRGSRSSSPGDPRATGALRPIARSGTPMRANIAVAIATGGPNAAVVSSTMALAETARMLGGQVPQARNAGAQDSPPSRSLTTAPSRLSSSAWPIARGRAGSLISAVIGTTLVTRVQRGAVTNLKMQAHGYYTSVHGVGGALRRLLCGATAGAEHRHVVHAEPLPSLASRAAVTAPWESSSRAVRSSVEFAPCPTEADDVGPVQVAEVGAREGNPGNEGENATTLNVDKDVRVLDTSGPRQEDLGAPGGRHGPRIHRTMSQGSTVVVVVRQGGDGGGLAAADHWLQASGTSAAASAIVAAAGRWRRLAAAGRRGDVPRSPAPPSAPPTHHFPSIGTIAATARPNQPRRPTRGAGIVMVPGATRDVRPMRDGGRGCRASMTSTTAGTGMHDGGIPWSGIVAKGGGVATADESLVRPTTMPSVSNPPNTPSRSTIALARAGQGPAAAMVSMARRAAAPPGSPTSRNWKVAPVGCPAPNEDEWGNDARAPCAACRGGSATSAVSIKTLQARVKKNVR